MVDIESYDRPLFQTVGAATWKAGSIQLDENGLWGSSRLTERRASSIVATWGWIEKAR